MREQYKSFTSFVILSIGVVVLLLVAAGCQIAGNKKLPDGAKKHLDELIGTGRYRIVSAEKAENPQANYRDVQEVWCVVLEGPHEVNTFSHPTLNYDDIVDGNYPILVHRIENYWTNARYNSSLLEYADRTDWLKVGCRENTYTDPY